MLTLEAVIVWGVAALVGSFLGNFLSGYLKQKGENLATHEDIDKLVDQVRAVSTTTNEIEAKISDEVWDRQKRWELKRDILLDAMKKTGDLIDSLAYLTSCQPEAEAKFAKASITLYQVIYLAELGCRSETILAMKQLSSVVWNHSEVTKDNPEVFRESQKQVRATLGAVKARIREELAHGSLKTPEPSDQG